MSGQPTGDGRTPAEFRRVVTQDSIDAYAMVSGDHNPLHTDPEFAATTPYGRTIAHGLLTLGILAEALADWQGPGWSDDAELDVTFVAPVFSGDEVVITGRPEDAGSAPRGEGFAYRLACESGERTVLVGTARRRSDG